MKKNTTIDSNPANRDPITKAPGSHPVGTGVGAAAGGAAGIAGAVAIGAAAGTAVGPVGTAAGAVAGAIVGGLAGKGVAEAVNPTVEDTYWRENHARQPYAGQRGYETYSDAYRVGYEGYDRHRGSGRSFDQHETDLRADFEARREGDSSLSWEDARFASRLAWDRVSRTASIDQNFERLVGYDVHDIEDKKIGTVHNFWVDEAGQPLFVGVKPGWLFGKNHIVPIHTAEVNNKKKLIRLPFLGEKIKDAPSFDADSEIGDADAQRVLDYYAVSVPGVSYADQTSRESSTSRGEARSDESATVRLHEEELKVGKREVSAGGVRLRKIVRIETVNQPIELRREEIVIERVAGGSDSDGDDADFSEEDIFIPLRREEAVVQKESHVREEVRVSKKAAIDRENITEELRSEDVKIEQTTDDKSSKIR